MEIKFLSDRDKRIARVHVVEMMIESDNDFVPPLSRRNSTTDSALKGDGEVFNGLQKYADSMLNQSVLGSYNDSELLGFVSFKENYTSDIIDSTMLPNIYVSTLIVKKSARGQGLTKKMYEKLFNDEFKSVNIFTRTWSTNMAHISILNKFGFEEFNRLKDDRGENVDTVYFMRKGEV